MKMVRTTAQQHLSHPFRLSPVLSKTYPAHSVMAPTRPVATPDSTKTAPQHRPNTFFSCNGLIDGKYHIFEEVGRGGRGVVFKAHDKQGRLVAVKMLLAHAHSYPGARERFIREAALLQMVSGPHTVQFYDSGLHKTDGEKMPYLVMEFLHGESLGSRLSRCGTFSTGDTLEILAQLLKALCQAHKVGIVHRDLKPANLFCVSPDRGRWRIKVLDYGLAKTLRAYCPNKRDGTLTQAGFIAGTPGYMAPELVCGLDQATPASDIYAVGCIAHHLLTGQIPFKGRTPVEIFITQLDNALPILWQELGEHPIQALIHKALTKNPNERFSDVIAMHQAVVALQVTLPKQVLQARMCVQPQTSTPTRSPF